MIEISFFIAFFCLIISNILSLLKLLNLNKKIKELERNLKIQNKL